MFAATGFKFAPDATNSMQLGSPARCWGFPRSSDQGATALLARGYVSRESGGVNIGGSLHSRFVVNMDIHHGNSGGPVVKDEDNHLSGMVLTKHKDLSPEALQVIHDISTRSSILRVGGSKSLGEDFLAMFQILESTMHLGMGEALPVSIMQEELQKALQATDHAVVDSASQASSSTQVSAAIVMNIPPEVISDAINSK